MSPESGSTQPVPTGGFRRYFPAWAVAVWLWLLKWPLFWLPPLVRHILRFFTNPHTLIGAFLRWIRMLFVHGCKATLQHVSAFLRRQDWILVTLQVVRVWLIIAGIYYVIFSHIDRQIDPRPEQDRTVVYLNQGTNWGPAANETDRQTYYYTAQGANVKEIRYSWFVHLERPWTTERFTAAKYMRSYGFIVDPAATTANPDSLPIGLTRRWDQKMGEMALDMTCAACHTGQLDTERNGVKYAVRIDGGGALHDLTNSSAGHFAGDLFASLIATTINPFKFRRFCGTVLAPGTPWYFCARLWGEFSWTTFNIVEQGIIDGSRHLYPVDEGYGRTDALGRIANNTFATNLHQEARNYKVADAPVSYPPTWDIWKLDWVQYTGSVSQPMARNIGESLGTGAKYYLLDTYNRVVSEEARYESSASVGGLDRIENALRDLKPPAWPEAVFGKIDQEKANAGRELFYQLCYRCHGPFYSTCAQLRVEAPLKSNTKDHWVTKMIPLDVVGTDKTSSINFVHNRFDLTRTGIKPDDLRKILEPTYAEKFQRIQALCPKDSTDPYCADMKMSQEEYLRRELGSIDPSAVSSGQGLTFFIGFIRNRSYTLMNIPDPEQDVMNGFAQLDTPRVMEGYRPRPLIGLWATPPFLHNGSVPNLYELLSPATERSAVFYLRSRDFDPYRVGLRGDANEKNVFRYDTRIPGNLNIGHEFRDGFREYTEDDLPYEKNGVAPKPRFGVIGRELTEAEKFEIIEYLKVMKEEDFPPPAGHIPTDVDKPEPNVTCEAVPETTLQQIRKLARQELAKPK